MGRDVNVVIDGYRSWSGVAQQLRQSEAWAGVLGWTSNAFNVGAAGVAHTR
jgi:hypothetical protein